MCSNSFNSSTEVGGYFGLDLPSYGDPFPSALKYQSARAALRAALEYMGVKRVLLPVYICDSVVQAVLDTGAVVEWYVLDDSLYPKNLPRQIPERSVVIYVNYFGLCDENVGRLLRAVSRQQVIIDNSQALFSASNNGVATIYSIRKYMGVPDGGLLVATEMDIKLPETVDTLSLFRMRSLLLRTGYSARVGYPSYLESEKSLNNTKPLQMSRLTSRLLASVDMDVVKYKRRKNFLALDDRLGKYNKHKWLIGSDMVPLCYPLVVDRNVAFLKQRLNDKGIFTPTYWPEVLSRAMRNSIEFRLLQSCIFVPCDQRYSELQMNTVAQVIIAGLDYLQY